MKVYNLACRQDHRFEGWFASATAYDEQQDRALIECPVCGSHEIRKMPAAPRLNLPRQGETARREAERAAQVERAGEGRAPRDERPVAGAGQPPAAESIERAQALYMMVARKLLESTEDVGERFAEEARRIHYSEAPERAIRGSATADEAQALRDEGIEVFTVPLPAALKEPLQ